MRLASRLGPCATFAPPPPSSCIQAAKPLKNSRLAGGCAFAQCRGHNAADQWGRPSCESNQASVINNEWHNQQGRRAPLCEAAEWETSGEGSRHCAWGKMIREGRGGATGRSRRLLLVGRSGRKWLCRALGALAVTTEVSLDEEGSLSTCTVLTLFFRFCIFQRIVNQNCRMYLYLYSGFFIV